MPARSGQNSGRLNTPLLGSITIEDLIVFSKRIINLIVLLCESLSSNTTWNLCFSQFWSFEKTSFFVFIHYFLSQTKMRFDEMVIGECEMELFLQSLAFL